MFLVTSLTVGGTENMVFQAASSLNREKYDISVCCIKGRGYFGDRLEERNIPVYYLGMGEKANLLVAFQFFGILARLSKLLKKLETDILHCYLFRANFIGRLAGKLAGVPVIIASIRGGTGEKSYHFWLYRLTDKFVNMVIANSELGRKFTIEKSHINENRIITIHNGIDISSFKLNCNNEKLQAELGIKQGDRIIGAVGRLHRIKGHVFFIRAAAMVAAKYNDVKFVIVGDGEMLAELKDEVQKLGISGRVIFTGERKDIGGLIPIFEIFVLPSLSEGISNAVIEAMACGKPVVATNVGGTPELVGDKKTGLLVPSENPETMAGAISWLLNNREKALEMGKNGRKVIEEKFSLPVMITKTEAVYEELLKAINGRS